MYGVGEEGVGEEKEEEEEGEWECAPARVAAAPTVSEAIINNERTDPSLCGWMCLQLY